MNQRSMLMLIKKAMLLFIAILLTCVSTKSIAESPVKGGGIDKDHPIYTFSPPGIKRILPQELLTLSDGIESPAYVHEVKWSLDLEKKRFFVGEPITGKLTVEHTGSLDRLHWYQMTRPYHGQRVSNLGLWYSRWKQDKKDANKGTWGSLKEAYKINFNSQWIHPSGKTTPVILKPKDRLEANVAFNVLHNSKYGRASSWMSGIGLYLPGKYRIYIRYINVNGYKGGLIDQKEKQFLKIKKGRLNVIPYRPIVIGPFDIEILPLNIPEEKEILVLLKQWNGLIATQYNRSSYDVVIPFAEVSSQSLKTIAKAKELRDSKFVSVRRSFLHTDVRYRLNKWLYRNRNGRGDKNKLNDLNRITENVLKEKLPRAIADAWKYTRCQILLQQGKVKEAISLAKKINTPDTEVFLDHIKYEKLKSK